MKQATHRQSLCRIQRIAIAIGIGVAAVATLMASPVTCQAALKKGDRIVFLGDSITQAGARPKGYVTLVRNAVNERYPDAGIEVLNAGISGHKVPNLQGRLQKDVLAKKPTIVIIYIGINDVWHSQSGRGTSAEDYETGLQDLIARITAAGARTILCTPSVIGEKTDGSNPLDKMLEDYSAISRKVAAKNDVPVIDLRVAFLGHLKQANSDNAPKGILTGDGVHLNDNGNRFVADRMLEGLGVTTADGGRVLRHVVLFKFKEGTTAEQIAEVEKAFAKLPDEIDTIVDFEWGTDNSPEGLSKGFTHCFLVSFRDEQGRAAYLPHAAHQKFVALLKPNLEDVLVVDYWADE